MRAAVIGFGAIGQAAAQRLAEAGAAVRVAQRSAPSLPSGMEFVRCDLTQAESVRAACAEATMVVLAAGLPYKKQVWRETWPVVMRNTLEACARSGARLVFVDNLYMYGPQTAPLTETMPLTDHGVKPRARAEITRIWQEAHAAGRVRVAACRGSDFYGPTAGALSRLGDLGLGKLAAGKAAMTIDPLDAPHDFTYTEDFGRAAADLALAPDDAFGQAWHVPNAAPTPTLRGLLDLGARLLGQERAKISPAPVALLRPFMPILQEMHEMRFQWDRPYHVDSTKFTTRFGWRATPFEEGVAATLRAYGAKV